MTGISSWSSLVLASLLLALPAQAQEREGHEEPAAPVVRARPATSGTRRELEQPEQEVEGATEAMGVLSQRLLSKHGELLGRVVAEERLRDGDVQVVRDEIPQRRRGDAHHGEPDEHGHETSVERGHAGLMQAPPGLDQPSPISRLRGECCARAHRQ